MSTIAPERTLDQQMRALQHANEIRVARAQLKRNLTGPSHAAALILDPPGSVTTMRAVDLLRAIPKYGLVKASRILRVCQISDSKTVGGLSERQREALARELRS